jgi:hypothetical protein
LQLDDDGPDLGISVDGGDPVFVDNVVELVEELLDSSTALELEFPELLLGETKEVGVGVDAALNLLFDVLAVLRNQLPEQVLLGGEVLGYLYPQVLQLLLRLVPARFYFA